MSFVTDQSDNLSCWSFDTRLKTVLKWFSIMCRKTKIQRTKDKGNLLKPSKLVTNNVALARETREDVCTRVAGFAFTSDWLKKRGVRVLNQAKPIPSRTYSTPK